MANIFKLGDTVKQKVPVIQGTVLKKEFIDDDICYLVQYTENGESLTRFFKESELEAV